MFLSYKNKPIIAEKQLNLSAISLVRGWFSLLNMMWSWELRLPVITDILNIYLVEFNTEKEL